MPTPLRLCAGVRLGESDEGGKELWLEGGAGVDRKITPRASTGYNSFPRRRQDVVSLPARRRHDVVTLSSAY